MAAKKRFYDGDYSGLNSARNMEKKDSRMISEDRSAFANMPQSSVIKAWPKNSHYSDVTLNDDISGVDSQMNEDSAGAKRHAAYNKW